MNRKLWLILLGVWFLLWGALAVTNFRFEAQNLVMGFLAIIVGVLVLFDR